MRFILFIIALCAMAAFCSCNTLRKERSYYINTIGGCQYIVNKKGGMCHRENCDYCLIRNAIPEFRIWQLPEEEVLIIDTLLPK